MAAIHKSQNPIIKGLNTKTYTIYGCLAKSCDILLGKVIGICLQGYLAHLGAVKEFAGMVYKRLNLLWAKQ
jgi:hypothetical protein